MALVSAVQNCDSLCVSLMRRSLLIFTAMSLRLPEKHKPVQLIKAKTGGIVEGAKKEDGQRRSSPTLVRGGITRGISQR